MEKDVIPRDQITSRVDALKKHILDELRGIYDDYGVSIGINTVWGSSDPTFHRKVHRWVSLEVEAQVHLDFGS